MGGYEKILESASPAYGYAAAGLLAFALGIAVTLLCFRIRELKKYDEEEDQQKSTD